MDLNNLRENAHNGARRRLSGTTEGRRRALCALEPPPRFRFPTTAPFEPVNIAPVEQVLPRFLASQEELLGALEAAQGLALDRARLTSPFNARLRYSKQD